MGKKSRRQNHQQNVKVHLCNSLTDKTTCRLLDELRERTSNFAIKYSSIVPSTVWDNYDDVVRITTALQERQGVSPMPLPQRQEGVADFMKWMIDNGSICHKVELVEYPDYGFGLRLLEAVTEEEKVLMIPDKLILTEEKAREGPLGKLIDKEPLLKEMPNLTLAIYLLNERYSTESFYRPYINILPHSFNLPLSFSKDDLLQLQGSPTLTECISQVRNIARLYTILHRQLKAHADPNLPLCTKGFHYSDFVWAVGCVMSRLNKIPSRSNPKENTLALIPLWDMANHEDGRLLTDFDVPSHMCVCYSMANYEKGDEFKIFYGPRSNSDLLINQGFTYEGNPYDVVKIQLGLGNGDETITELQRQILARLQILVPGSFTISSYFSMELICFVRVFTASRDQLVEWAKLDMDGLSDQLRSTTWRASDMKALEFLEKRCTLLLQPYKSTIEEDDILLTSGKLSSRHRDIVRLREGEKKILQSGADYCRVMREGWERGALEKVQAAAKTDSSTKNEPNQEVERKKEDNTVDVSKTTKLTNGDVNEHDDASDTNCDTSNTNCDTSDTNCDTTDCKNQKVNDTSNIVDTTAITCS